MKLLPLILLAPTIAYAGSFFQFEAGAGASFASDVDGVWTQHNVSSNYERLKTPAFTAGFTGELYAHRNWSLRYHADYVYAGTQTASCACVTDEAYAARDYAAPKVEFHGSGHVQGIALTLEPGYTWHGTRFAVEGGPFLFWNRWNEVIYNPHLNVEADRGMKVGYVVGARVERGNLSLSYRYFTHLERSNSVMPGLVRNLQLVTLNWRF